MNNPTYAASRTLGRLSRRESAFPRPFLSSLATATFAIGLAASSPAQADVVAGIDVWDSATTPTVSVTAPDIVATAVATGTGGNWTNGDGSGRGSSKDGTWGTFNSGTLASTVTNVGPSNLTLTNGKTNGEITLTITNNGLSDIALEAFHFDAVAFRPNAARTYALNVLAGSDITEGNVFTSTEDEITSLNGNLKIDDLDPETHDQHDDIDIALTGLADATLEAGGTVIFELAFSDGSGSGGGHHLFLDNVAVTTAPATTNRLAVTTVPASATAGTDFSVTVEAQDSGGNPIVVSQNTTISLSASGAGVLSGNTATILAGTSSVVLNTMQYTNAGVVTLIALRTGGDELLPSDPSDPITIDPGPAADLFIETAADGSGSVVGDTNLLPDDNLTVYAITRDSLGNFVENVIPVWSLENITGDIFPSDLTDNGDGSALFEAIDFGTCNIRAAFGGFTDADSGLISVVELVSRFTGGGANGSWQTAGNWSFGIAPAFDNTTDLFFSDPANSKGSPYIGADITVRSLNFDTDSTGGLNIPLVLPGNVDGANLTFDTDSATEPAEINVDAAFTGNIIIGFTGSSAGEDRNVILADDLLFTHEGSAQVVINGDIDEIDGSFGLTKAGPGTLILSGTNTYTGATNVDAGCLVLRSIDSILALTSVSVADGAGFGGDVSPGGLSDAEIQAIVDDVSWSSGAFLVIDTDGADVTVSANITGDIGLIKKGEGVLTLTGTNTFTGPTVVEAGSIAGGDPTPISITSISRSGNQVTMTFTAEGNVDVYKSTDLVDFGVAPIATDLAPGTDVTIDGAASESSAFYVLVPTGDPAP